MTESDFQRRPAIPANVNTGRRIALGVILLFVFVLIFLGGWYSLYVVSPGPQTGSETVIVTIPKGTSVRGIGEILDEAGLIRNDIRFLLLAKYTGYGNRLQAGEFKLFTGQPPGKVLETLASARSIQYSVTIPEGLRASEIAEIFGEGGWCDPKSFNNLVHDKRFLEKLGYANLDSLEGYLFPDTYLFTRDYFSTEKIIALMTKRFADVWGELVSELEQEPDREKTVILASIVEEETGAAEERPLIAGVFQRRLKLGMRLQSDPTVVYGVNAFSGRITRKDLLTPTPYNTYTLPGLPAGPICNPGRDALEAVLHPTPTKKLYFVSKNDGTHHFSATLAEHNRAVKKYQKKKTAKKGK